MLFDWILFAYEEASEIAYISMAFSVLSIIISLLSMITQRNIISTRHYVSVEFNAKGSAIVSNINQCQYRKSELQTRIASLVGVDRDLIETLRP